MNNARLGDYHFSIKERGETEAQHIERQVRILRRLQKILGGHQIIFIEPLGEFGISPRFGLLHTDTRIDSALKIHHRTDFIIIHGITEAQVKLLGIQYGSWSNTYNTTRTWIQRSSSPLLTNFQRTTGSRCYG